LSAHRVRRERQQKSASKRICRTSRHSSGGWAGEGDGGLTAITHRCSGGACRAGRATLLTRFRRAAQGAVGRTWDRGSRRAAHPRAKCRRHSAYGMMVRLVMRRALAGSPFAFVVTTLAKALCRALHADRLEGDNVRNRLEVVCGVLHGAAPLGEAGLVPWHSDREVRAANARPAGGCASGSRTIAPEPRARGQRRGTQ
jgi:hypothetical protein